MFRRKPTIPKPLEHWFGDLPSISRLREILDDPVFRTAAATLLAAAQPSYRSIVTPEQNNLRQAWLAGYNDFFNDLETLVKAPKGSGPMPEEWSHFN